MINSDCNVGFVLNFTESLNTYFFLTITTFSLSIIAVSPEILSLPTGKNFTPSISISFLYKKLFELKLIEHINKKHTNVGQMQSCIAWYCLRFF